MPLTVSFRTPGWPKSTLILVTLCLGILTNGCTSSPSSSNRIASTLSEGLAAQARGDNATASADYLSVVALQPGDYLAWYDLGVIAGHTGDETEAIRDYSQAISAKPDYVPALYNLATSEASSNPTGASGLYERVISLQPKNADALFNEGLLLKASGHTSAGRQDLAKAVSLDPSLASRG